MKNYKNYLEQSRKAQEWQKEMLSRAEAAGHKVVDDMIIVDESRASAATKPFYKILSDGNKLRGDELQLVVDAITATAGASHTTRLTTGPNKLRGDEPKLVIIDDPCSDEGGPTKEQVMKRWGDVNPRSIPKPCPICGTLYGHQWNCSLNQK